MNFSITQFPAVQGSFTPVPSGRRIDMLVMHATAGTKQSDLITLTGRDVRRLVSIHYYITKLGEIFQMVQDKDVAWHAGVSFWQGESNCNIFSIGVELENLNNGRDRYPQAQYDAAVWLVRNKVQQYRIPRSRLVRHADIARGLKTDPRGFPWDAFQADVYRGLPDEPPPPPPSAEERLRDALIEYSYRRVNHVYHPEWSMHRFALTNRLGPPLGPQYRFAAERRNWVAELYGTDAVAAPDGAPQDLRRLSQLDEGELKTVLRDASYKQLGLQYHPDWPMHQYADRNKLGVALAEKFPASISDGRAFEIQIFELDTLFSPAKKSSLVLPLSSLTEAGPIDGTDGELRDLLLERQYTRIGSHYRPDSELHKAAIAQRLGAPLSDQESLTVDSRTYLVAAYARDVLYTTTGDWRQLQRLSELLSTTPIEQSFNTFELAPVGEQMGGDL